MAKPDVRLSSSQEAWLLALAAAAVLPLLPFAPGWLGLAAALLLAWRGGLWWRRAPLPPGWLLTLLTAAGGLAVFLSFRQFFGRDPGIAFLVGLTCLKLFECRTPRDGLTVVFLSWFLQLGLFFYSQTPQTAALSAAGLLLGTATLASLNHAGRPALALLKLAGRLLLQATPFMLLLFLLFPRVQGPLWGLPMDAFTARSGLSDSMAPGSISRLILSDAVAFRVKFEADRPPPRPLLYWRGPVLTDFDGRTWRPRVTGAAASLPYTFKTAADRHVRHTVTLEPHNQTWLFALELPASLPEGSLMTSDYRLLARDPVRARLRYTLDSLPYLQVGAQAGRQALQAALALPAGLNPRARALAEGWRAARPEEALARALAFYRGNGFRYTLEPPLAGEHGVDEFLFDSRRGFCEHFAGSFVFLMRAAGVPARVVTGYQGGDMNPVDGFLVVRQSDAHAWAEVWLAGVGWRRVDPTALAAPARVDSGLAAAVPRGEPLPLALRTDLEWLRNLRWRWDAVSNGWNQWVLGYNPERQRQLMARLGLPDADWQQLSALLAGSIGVLMLGYLAWALRKPPHPDPALKAWEVLSARLARRGLGRRPEEGPLDYRDRVSRTRPDLADEMNTITALYVGCRYGGRQEQCRRLEQAVVRLRT